MNERAKNESLAKPWAAVAVARVVVSYGRDRDGEAGRGGCARGLATDTMVTRATCLQQTRE